LKRLMVLAAVLLSVPVAVVVSGPAAPAGAASSVGGPITRAEIIQRARLWYTNGYVWDQDAVHPDPAGKPYRSDCSGFVSMAWHLADSLSTPTLPSVAQKIAVSALQPGDILLAQVDANHEFGHTAIFDKWADAAKTSYWGYDHGGGVLKYQVYGVQRPGDSRFYEPYRYGNVLETPTGTVSRMSGSNGTGSVIGTVNLPYFTGAVGVQAYVDGVGQGDVPSSTGSGNRSFTAPFNASVTAAHRICVKAWNGATWTSIGTCLETARGYLTALGGANANGTATGVADVPGLTDPVQVRLIVNNVGQPTAFTGGGTGYRTFTTTFTRQGTGSQKVCAQGNSYGYWHPIGDCLSTATGTFGSMTGTSGSGNAVGTVSAPGWSQGIQVRATVNGVAQPWRYSDAATRTYSTPFTVAAGSTNQICVQANTYGYWTTLGCRSRTG